MTVAVVVKMTVAEGRNAEFEAMYAKLIADINEKEPDCTFYQVAKSRTNPQVYVALEEYVDQAAREAHNRTDYTRQYGGLIVTMLDGVPEMEEFDSI